MDLPHGWRDVGGDSPTYYRIYEYDGTEPARVKIEYQPAHVDVNTRWRLTVDAKNADGEFVSGSKADVMAVAHKIMGVITSIEDNVGNKD